LRFCLSRGANGFGSPLSRIHLFPWRPHLCALSASHRTLPANACVRSRTGCSQFAVFAARGGCHPTLSTLMLQTYRLNATAIAPEGTLNGQFEIAWTEVGSKVTTIATCRRDPADHRRRGRVGGAGRRGTALAHVEALHASSRNFASCLERIVNAWRIELHNSRTTQTPAGAEHLQYRPGSG
jgi:hypothetical protein